MTTELIAQAHKMADGLVSMTQNGASSPVVTMLRQLAAALEQQAATETKGSAFALKEGPLPMETAPKDGTMLRLLVQFENCSFDDSNLPCWVCGFNLADNTGEDKWQFPGWSWTHDYILDGSDDGKPVGWLPMLGTAAPVQQVDALKQQLADVTDDYQRLLLEKQDRICSALAAQPAAQRVPLTDEMVTKAARELCKIHAMECSVDKQDTWNLYAEQFKRDARAMLEAAHGITSTSDQKGAR